MTTRSSIRTDWPGPPRHRHRKATPRRWAVPGRLGVPGRIGLGVVALLAGVLALNGVIQAYGSPARTAGSSPDVDIASLLPPPPAAIPTPAATPTAQVAVVDERTQVGGNPESHPAAAPRRSTGATQASPRATSKAGGQVPGRQTEAAAGQNRTTPGDEPRGDERSTAGQPVSGESAAIAPDDEAQPNDDKGPEPARNDATRTGRSGGLLDTVRCAVKVSDKPLLGGCP